MYNSSTGSSMNDVWASVKLIEGEEEARSRTFLHATELSDMEIYWDYYVFIQLIILWIRSVSLNSLTYRHHRELDLGPQILFQELFEPDEYFSAQSVGS